MEISGFVEWNFVDVAMFSAAGLGFGGVGDLKAVRGSVDVRIAECGGFLCCVVLVFGGLFRNKIITS